jgi:hypothetical protein
MNVINDSMLNFSEYQNFMDKSAHNIILGNLMIAHLAAGNTEKADSIWFNLYNDPPHPLREDMKADFYLFRLFSLLQNKNAELLPSFALSATRYYRKSASYESVFKVELSISRLLIKEQDYRNPDIRAGLFVEIKIILENYIAGLDGIAGFQEQYTRYMIWIKSMMTERPFYLVAAEWYERYYDHTSAVKII